MRRSVLVTMLTTLLLTGCGNDVRQVDAPPAEWTTPSNLGPGINTAAAELQVGIAPDGQTLYLSSDRPGGAGQQDLWMSHRRPDRTWGDPVNLGPPFNTPFVESSPTLSADRHYLYFASARLGGMGGLDCWRSYRDNIADDSSWHAPEDLGPSINSTFDEGDCLPHIDGRGRQSLWFVSRGRPEGQGDWDIYVSDVAADGRFLPAVPVVALNSPYRDTRMTLSADGLEIIFSSARPGGQGGIDLWSAHRPTADAQFCKPENLGVAINSSSDERSPSLTADGRELFFTSTRGSGLGSVDVFVTTRSHIPGAQNCH